MHGTIAAGVVAALAWTRPVVAAAYATREELRVRMLMFDLAPDLKCGFKYMDRILIELNTRIFKTITRVRL